MDEQDFDFELTDEEVLQIQTAFRAAGSVVGKMLRQRGEIANLAQFKMIMRDCGELISAEALNQFRNDELLEQLWEEHQNVGEKQ